MNSLATLKTARIAPVTVICTVKNEEGSISVLLDSIARQTMMPQQAIFVDGGSSDRTVDIISSYSTRLNSKVIIEKGATIGKGRNVAIEHSASDIIACTDGGCILDEMWLERIIKPLLSDDKRIIVSGAYLPWCVNAQDLPIAHSFISRIEELDERTFMPSSRSIAFTKKAWLEVGGYPEEVTFAEDTLFNLRLKRVGYRFVLVRDAIVFWKVDVRPRSIIRQFYRYQKAEGQLGLFPQRFLVRFLFAVSVPVISVALLGYFAGLMVTVAIVLFGLLLKHAQIFDSQSFSSIVRSILVAASIEVGVFAGYAAGLLSSLRYRLRHARLRDASKADSRE